ncbi:hypothetical protein [Dehalobacterium formicoaceticum]|uniref:Uncharacterized protein n=1 Tax=Dehalobacterium formicoaceticum TaxID=51515 RepID=A0ABT1Y2T9_9FIRM|nr:hypothetical protein [Dehalobacterium formicoaceticum]MCR6545181.1 hypothetical protein [Dehalobacterium formicoaceticum]
MATKLSINMIPGATGPKPMEASQEKAAISPGYLPITPGMSWRILKPVIKPTNINMIRKESGRRKRHLPERSIITVMI